MRNLFSSLVIGLLFPLLFACNQKTDYSPRKINFDRDDCVVCRMGLTDQKYSAQAINRFGEVFWYDDLGCLVEHTKMKEWKTWGGDSAKIYIGNCETGKWIDARKAWYRFGDKTPMGYGYGALEEKTDSLFDFKTTVKKILNGETAREKFLKEYKMLKK